VFKDSLNTFKQPVKAIAMNELSSSDLQSKSVTNDINIESENTIADFKKQLPKEPKPLMRYFDLIDDTTNCYVLGYN